MTVDIIMIDGSQPFTGALKFVYCSHVIKKCSNTSKFVFKNVPHMRFLGFF